MKVIDFSSIRRDFSGNAVRITDDFKYVNAIDLVQAVNEVDRATACSSLRYVKDFFIGEHVIPGQMGPGRPTKLIPLRYSMDFVNIICGRTPLSITTQYAAILKRLYQGDHSLVIDSSTPHPGRHMPEDEEDEPVPASGGEGEGAAATSASSGGAPGSTAPRLPLVVKPGCYETISTQVVGQSSSQYTSSVGIFRPMESGVRIGMGEHQSLAVYPGNLVKVQDLIASALCVTKDDAYQVFLVNDCFDSCLFTI